MPTKSEPNRQPDGTFGPGNCANPNGRPRYADALATRIRDAAQAGDIDRLEAALNQAWAKAARGDLGALGFLVDHGWGKLPMPVDVEGDPVLQLRIVRDDNG